MSATKKTTETIDPVMDANVKDKSTVSDAKVEPPKGDAKKDEAVKGDAVAGTAPVGKKSLGQKEIIPFEWKLMGESAGCFLTLFKAIELEEVEAQMERVRREGYYKNLKILANTDKIVQSKTGLKVKKEMAESKTIVKSTATKLSKSANKVSVVKISMRASLKKSIKAAKIKEMKEKKAKKAKKAKKVTKKKTAIKKTVKSKKTTNKKKAVKKKAVKKKSATSKTTKKSTSAKKKTKTANITKSTKSPKKTSAKKKRK